jgi:hypothetical protein
MQADYGQWWRAIISFDREKIAWERRKETKENLLKHNWERECTQQSCTRTNDRRLGGRGDDEGRCRGKLAEGKGLTAPSVSSNESVDIFREFGIDDSSFDSILNKKYFNLTRGKKPRSGVLWGNDPLLKMWVICGVGHSSLVSGCVRNSAWGGVVNPPAVSVHTDLSTLWIQNRISGRPSFYSSLPAHSLWTLRPTHHSEATFQHG